MSEIVNHDLPKEIDGLTITGSNVLGTAKIKFNGIDVLFGGNPFIRYSGGKG